MITHKSSRKQKAFTLIEVVVATFVVAIALVALANTVQAVTREQSDLSIKFFANLVASNKMAELQSLPQWPELGESNDDDDIEMADRSWFIEMEVTATAVESLRRVDLKVGVNDETKQIEAVMTGFLGQTPQIGGEKVAWTQTDPTLGGADPGGRNDEDGNDEPNPDESPPTPLNPN